MRKSSGYVESIQGLQNEVHNANYWRIKAAEERRKEKAEQQHISYKKQIALSELQRHFKTHAEQYGLVGINNLYRINIRQRIISDITRGTTSSDDLQIRTIIPYLDNIYNRELKTIENIYKADQKARGIIPIRSGPRKRAKKKKHSFIFCLFCLPFLIFLLPFFIIQGLTKAGKRRYQ